MHWNDFLKALQDRNFEKHYKQLISCMKLPSFNFPTVNIQFLIIVDTLLCRLLKYYMQSFN
jgi:hypothetical protein